MKLSEAIIAGSSMARHVKGIWLQAQGGGYQACALGMAFLATADQDRVDEVISKPRGERNGLIYNHVQDTFGNPDIMIEIGGIQTSDTLLSYTTWVNDTTALTPAEIAERVAKFETT